MTEADHESSQLKKPYDNGVLINFLSVIMRLSFDAVR